MRDGSLETSDFWQVNSYGYPNPFNLDPKSQQAWSTFKAFVDYDGASYHDLKKFWASADAPRKISSHSVESWKATFEEFGLLYVLNRSNRIVITPGGHQIVAACGESNDTKFVWIGLNLLFRYPLQGRPGGRRKHSEILPYRFLYSAMRDLGDYFWFVELERVLGRVFALQEAKAAVEVIRQLRANPSELDKFPLPPEGQEKGFYNSLNQVANHAGMNHLLLTQDNGSEHYATTESRRRHLINRSYLSIVSAALGDSLDESDCVQSALYVDRLPSAPSFTDEQAYFDYMGASVAPIEVAGSSSSPRAINLAGDQVFILKEGEHFHPTSQGPGFEKRIRGKSFTFCRIARSHRIILSTDLSWTYLVTGKDLIGPDTVQLTLKRAKPITSAMPIEDILGAGTNA